MLNNPEIGAAVFSVKNLKRTRHFYEGILGLEAELTSGHEYPYLVVNTRHMVLVFIEGQEKSCRTPVLVFNIDGHDIYELVEELVKHDVQIIEPVQPAPDGGLTADFQDPDGYVLSFYHSP
ncbi:hypothetical protein HMF8227_01319 [Saliniradius amylolyticus]|uniref:VOC domain-containing protein n=1 Tax=Saliniradius amylolyticus TaxID=2183582 RepID=A0A2S2E461_9ALTE|nr:VOC family protein [Saliniradius amylolyticus]AWL11797.1 hypothetical protein HMF8227_01319 [Saliniradius amylolyticus]